MNTLGCGFSVVAVVFGVLGTIPFLGWINWFTTLPAAILAIAFSLLGLSRDGRSNGAVLGLIAGVITLFWAIFRLSIGGGVI